MRTKLQYTGDNSNRGFSPRIWADCPVDEWPFDNNSGIIFSDEFLTGNTATIGTDTNFAGRWVVGGTGTGTVTILADALGGQCRLRTGTTADNENNMQLSVGSAFSIDSSPAKKLWYEARVKVASIADSKASILVGLAQAAATGADGLLGDTQDGTLANALADIDALGFLRYDADGDKFDIVYKKNGQTAQTVLADAVTLVADTFIKVGFKFDYTNPAARRITFYANGVDVATYVTNTMITAATFPEGEGMTPTFVVKTDEAAANDLVIDWVQIAAEM